MIKESESPGLKFHRPSDVIACLQTCYTIKYIKQKQKQQINLAYMIYGYDISNHLFGFDKLILMQIIGKHMFDRYFIPTKTTRGLILLIAFFYSTLMKFFYQLTSTDA